MICDFQLYNVTNV